MRKPIELSTAQTGMLAWIHEQGIRADERQAVFGELRDAFCAYVLKEHGASGEYRLEDNRLVPKDPAPPQT